MSDSEALDSTYHFSIERGNRDLAAQQVQKINTALRKVRRINKKSQQGMAPVVRLSSEPKAEVSAASVPNIVEVLPDDLSPPVPRSRVEDTTDSFMLPEPSRLSLVATAFKKAMEDLEEEESHFRSPNGKGSPVVKTWKVM